MRGFGGGVMAAILMASAAAQACSLPTTVPAPTQIDAGATAAPSPSAVPSGLPGSNPGGDRQVAGDAALRDAAAHLGVSPGELRVDQLEPRQWGDASLGCPRPGILYAQVVTPGFLIVIHGGGKELEYHSDGRGRVVLCQER
jgi:hypothetical protein